MVKRRSVTPGEETSLELLQRVDAGLQELFSSVLRTQADLARADDSNAIVELEYEYGALAHEILRSLALRQSCAMDVSSRISAVPGLRSTSEEIIERGTSCRALINALKDMSYGVEPMNLNIGQDFDGPLTSLIALSGATIAWELGEAVPRITASLTSSETRVKFRSSGYALRHAPEWLNPKGPRWYERAPVVSRVVAIYERIKGVQV